MAGDAGKATDAVKREEGAGGKLEIILAFAFGSVFSLVLLALAFFVRDPTDLAVFVTRVVMALAAAGIGAVLPGLLHVEIKSIPGVAVRGSGALALGALVYLVNPPALVQHSKQVRSALFDVQFALARGNTDWAAGKLQEISRLLPNCPDVTYLQGIVSRQRGQLDIAKHYFDAVSSAAATAEPCFVAVAPAEIAYQRALLADLQGDAARASTEIEMVLRTATPGTTLYGDALYERGRLRLLLAMQAMARDEPAWSRDAAQIESDFRAFLDGSWPGIDHKHWAKYHLACLHAHLAGSDLASPRAEQARQWAAAFFLISPA
ncbi:hypothetical protein [Desertibaculum subflavum]|uniref:hypothetical protein n=1 Tax=Desertibaculum subflavum TaxID=2268458 RepID=UPI000E66079A